jgi:hypothetical protein
VSAPADPFDALPWRLGERIAELAGRARRRVRALRRRVVAPRAVDAAAAPAVRLARALRAGAHADAAALAAPLLDAAARAPLDPALAAPLVEYLLVVGDDARAAALARDHETALARTAGGATLLSLLDLGERPLALPDGRLDAVALSRQIEAGRCDADRARALLRARPLELLRRPELHLLEWNAARTSAPARALAALDRFLRARGLPPAELGAGETVLDRLRFPVPPRPRHGPLGGLSRGVRGRKLVSVLVAAHRAEATLPYALASLCAQSYRDLEILVCDDASPDATAAVAAGFADDPRVRVFRSAANQGPYNIRNALLREARGELVAFHDADDVALPDRVAVQVAALERGARACLTTWLRVTPDGRFVFFADQAAVRLALVSAIYPRALLDELGGFRAAKFGADLDFHERVRLHVGDDAIAILRRPQLLGLWSTTSLTRKAGAEALEDGYRAPARRAYAQLLAERADGRRADAELTAALADLDLLIPPQPIAPFVASARSTP